MKREDVVAILDGACRTSMHYGHTVAIIEGDLTDIFRMASVVDGLTRSSSKHQPLQADSNMLPPCF